MAQDVCGIVGAEDCGRLAASVGERPLKHVRRARIILGSAERISTEEALEKLLALNLGRQRRHEKQS